MVIHCRLAAQYSVQVTVTRLSVFDTNYSTVQKKLNSDPWDCPVVTRVHPLSCALWDFSQAICPVA